MKSGTCPTPYARIHTLLCSPCSLNFSNLCDNFVKKLVSEIRKCLQLQWDFVPLTPDQGLCPWTPLGPPPPSPHYTICRGVHSPEPMKHSPSSHQISPRNTMMKTDDWSTFDKTHIRKAQFHCRILTLSD